MWKLPKKDQREKMTTTHYLIVAAIVVVAIALGLSIYGMFSGVLTWFFVGIGLLIFPIAVAYLVKKI